MNTWKQRAKISVIEQFRVWKALEIVQGGYDETERAERLAGLNEACDIAIRKIVFGEPYPDDASTEA